MLSPDGRTVASPDISGPGCSGDGVLISAAGSTPRKIEVPGFAQSWLDATHVTCLHAGANGPEAPEVDIVDPGTGSISATGFFGYQIDALPPF